MSRALPILVALALVPAALRAQAAAPPPPLASFDTAWAVLARTYWDTTLVQGRWRAVRDSLRWSLPADADEARVRAAIRALLALPAQSHFVLLPASAAPVGGRVARQPGTTGLEVRPVEGAIVASRVAPGSVAELAGVRPGDRIVQVDSVALDSVQARLREAAAGDADRADRLLATFVAARLGGADGEEVLVHVVHADGRRRALLLERGPLVGQVTQYGNLPPFAVQVGGSRLPLADGRSALLLRLGGWFPVASTTLDSVLFAGRDAAGLIIDLRGNPGGVIGMIAGVSGHLLDTAVTLGDLRSRTNTLRFSANPRRVTSAGVAAPPFAGPVAILVDEFSASTSEFFASGMQALGRARVFGTRSAGQALPAAMGRLPNGDVMMHVIADHTDPRGRRVEGVGVVPDVAVPLRLDDLRAGRDAALEAARAWLAGARP